MARPACTIGPSPDFAWRKAAENPANPECPAATADLRSAGLNGASCAVPHQKAQGIATLRKRKEWSARAEPSLPCRNGEAAYAESKAFEPDFLPERKARPLARSPAKARHPVNRPWNPHGLRFACSDRPCRYGWRSPRLRCPPPKETSCGTWCTRTWWETATIVDVHARLAAGANPNTRDENNVTPLHFAAQSGHTAAVAALVLGGARLNTRTADDWTSLHCAATEGHVDTVRVLIRAGFGSARENGGRLDRAAFRSGFTDTPMRSGC